MKLSCVTRVCVLEHDEGMLEKLESYFEKRPDIEMIRFERSRVETALNASKEVYDVIVSDLDLMEDLRWLVSQEGFRGIPLVAFADPEVSGQRELRLYRTVDRPDENDEQSVDKAFRMLAYAIRCAKDDAEPKPIGSELSLSGSEPASHGTYRVIVIGASAGGVEALTQITSQLRKDMPPIVVVQHIAPGFDEIFAEHLSKAGCLDAGVARDGEEIRAGHMYIAPCKRQTSLEKTGGRYRLKCVDRGSVDGHAPSINVLFESAAENAGSEAVGVLLTGMGSDGARGLLKMRNAGAATIAQDESTSVVYGMPKAACEIGAVEMRLPVYAIGPELNKYAHKGELANE